MQPRTGTVLRKVQYETYKRPIHAAGVLIQNFCLSARQCFPSPVSSFWASFSSDQCATSPRLCRTSTSGQKTLAPYCPNAASDVDVASRRARSSKSATSVNTLGVLPAERLGEVSAQSRENETW